MRRGFFARLLGRRRDVCGVYLWGGVGRGKSMLMDLAFDQIAVEPKRRVHFHAFMLEVHERLRIERAKGTWRPDPRRRRSHRRGKRPALLRRDGGQQSRRRDDPVAAVHRLLEEGVAVVTTSNRCPRDLYKDGLNRELFLPFIHLLEDKLEVVPLDGPTDYRLDRLHGVETWHVPNGPAATEALSRPSSS
jgi:cell division protein ZapE